MSANPPNAWPIEPGRGIGALRIGMPLDAAIRTLDGIGLGPVTQSENGSTTVYLTRTPTIKLVPGPASVALPATAQTVSEIELVALKSVPPDQQPQAELFGQPLLGSPLRDVQNLLSAADTRTERRGDLVEAPGLGVRVWSGGQSPHRPVDSVTVSRPTPPAIVIVPGFTFAELDGLAKTLGFTGGATTARAPLVAGEPEVAEWSQRQVLLRYTFDPVTFLRVIYLDGPDAAESPAVRQLVAQLPLVTETQVLDDLGSDDDETSLRAIQAVSVLRLTAARAALRRLSQDATEPQRSAALRAMIGLPDPV